MVSIQSSSQSSVLQVLSTLLTLFGGFLLGGGISLVQMDHHLGPLQITAGSGILVVGFGIALLLIAALGRRIPTALQLSAATMGFCLATILCFTAPLGTAEVMEANQEGFQPNQPPIRYYKSTIQPGHTYYASGYIDTVRGWRLTPGSYALETHLPDYKDTRYQIDLEGWRECPDLRRRVIFLGCSFTFGAGVQDDEFFVG